MHFSFAPNGYAIVFLETNCLNHYFSLQKHLPNVSSLFYCVPIVIKIFVIFSFIFFGNFYRKKISGCYCCSVSGTKIYEDIIMQLFLHFENNYFFWSQFLWNSENKMSAKSFINSNKHHLNNTIFCYEWDTLHKICKDWGFYWPIFFCIYDSVLIWENMGQWKSVLLYILSSGQ